MTPDEEKLIREAAEFFEKPGAFERVLGLTGNWIEDGLQKLPVKVQTSIQTASKVAIEKCLRIAVKTIDDAPPGADPVRTARQSLRAHTAMTGLTGAVSGFFGPETLVVELPLSTSLIMRSIAATAKEFGFDLNDSETLLECLFVFTLGGRGATDDGMNSAYLSNRIAFQGMVRAALDLLGSVSTRALLAMIDHGTAPVLVRLIAAVADAFGVRVTQKLLVQSTPIIGAIGGAAINAAFTNYFGTAARHHFALKRLTARHGDSSVMAIYHATVRRPTGPAR